MRITPTKKQLAFMDWEIGMFFHFGIRSFFPGHEDWDGKPMPASAFHPTELDCKQWMRVAKSAGAKYAILTCKHHDGFANWQSKYSDYSVAQSPWEGGKGDVVEAFVKACRLYGLKVGLYYSPAQWGGSVSFTTPKEYDDYFINQISELLSNYGKIDYLWFDACGSEDHEYDKERIIRAIRSLQPEILIFSMWDPDTRWTGNEDGYSQMPNPYTVTDAAFSVNTTDNVSLGDTRFLPAECDIKLRDTWFDCEANEDTIKTLDELMGIYEYSVGRGSNLLINVGPDCRGRVPEADAARIREFGEEVARRYGQPLPFGDICAEGNLFSIHTADYKKSQNSERIGTTLVDTIVIEEDLTDGEAVTEFRILMQPPVYTKSIPVYYGKTIGHKAICRIPTFLTGKVTVEILSSDGPAKLRSIRAYCIHSIT